MPSSAILLLDHDTSSAAHIGGVLTRTGYAVETVTDADEAIRRAVDHSLVVIDVTGDARTPADVCREIRSKPELAFIPVLCICQSDDIEERIRFLEAGAEDVVTKPFDDRELEARVEALLVRFQRSRDRGPTVSATSGVEPIRRSVAVFSPKGGVGTTTIAVNIAVAQAGGRPDRVLLVDLDLQFGQVATHLDIVPRQTIADLVRDGQAQREPELFRTYATTHESGLNVLAAPGSPELAELVLPEHVERILETAVRTYDAVVIDSGSTLDERVLVALDQADGVIVPVHPEIAALKAVRLFLEYANEAGAIGAKTTIVLNSAFGREILKPGDIEQALGARVSARLPYDSFAYLKAVNEGKPVVWGSPKSAAAAGLIKLAVIAFSDTPATVGIGTDDRKSGRLSSLLKRA